MDTGSVLIQKGKLPPQAIDLEQVILGAVLIDKRGMDAAIDVLRAPEAFYKHSHCKIFEAMLWLYKTNDPIDILTVSQRLKSMGFLDQTGGEMYLIELSQMVSSAAHIEHHCRIVLQKYFRRELIKVGGEIIQQGYDDTADVFDVLDGAEQTFTTISEMISKGKVGQSWPELLRQVADRVEFLTNNDSDVTGITTGLAKLDKFTGGWQPTDFIVIGARPGMGKTAYVVLNALAAAKSGVPVGFVSLEMSGIQLAIRGVSVSSNFHMRQLNQTGFDKTEYFQTLNRLILQMEGLPVHIDDRPGLTIGDIKRKARSMKRRFDIGVLIVDYIQLAQGHPDIRIRTSETSQGLKHIAKELEIPVIALSQLSRDVESSADKRPALRHLKESGAIEQDADVVAFIFRPEYYGISPDPDVLELDENTEFIFAKHRNGGIGTVGAWYEANKTKFMDKKPF